MGRGGSCYYHSLNKRKISLIASIILDHAGTLHEDIIFLFKVSLFRGFIILAHFNHEDSFLHELVQKTMQTRSEED